MKYFLSKNLFIFFVISILCSPLTVLAGESPKKASPKKESTSTPFLFVDTVPKQPNDVKEAAPKSISSPITGFAAPSSSFLDSFVTPKGEIDVGKIMILAIILALSIFFLILIAGILVIVSVFREPKSFSRKQILAISWNAFQKNRKFLVLFTIVEVLLCFGIFILSVLSYKISPALSWFVGSIGSLLALLVGGLFVKNILLLLDDKGPRIVPSTKDIGFYGKFILTLIFYAIIVSLPLAVIAVTIAFLYVLVLFYAQNLPPGYPMIVYLLLSCIGVWGSITLAIRASLSPFAVLNNNSNPFRAILMSWSLTKGKTGGLFLLWYLLILMNILGFLTLFGIGSFFTIPLTFVVLASTYKNLDSGSAHN